AASVSELQKLVVDNEKADGAKSRDVVPKDVVVEIVDEKSGEKTDLKQYKADIIRNVKIKEFPETESQARNMVTKLFESFVSTTVSDLLKQEINQLLSMDSDSALGSKLSQPQHNQTRFESDN
ncbi:hypothetical protein LPJ53_006481, partial [Coemansia erecta]